MAEFPLRKFIDSAKALQKHKPPTGQAFCVMAYVLASEVKEGNYGSWIVLGCYKNEEEAVRVANHLMTSTGHRHIICAPTCSWRQLTDRVNPQQTTYIEEKIPVPQKANLEQIGAAD